MRTRSAGAITPLPAFCCCMQMVSREETAALRKHFKADFIESVNQKTNKKNLRRLQWYRENSPKCILTLMHISVRLDVSQEGIQVLGGSRMIHSYQRIPATYTPTQTWPRVGSLLVSRLLIPRPDQITSPLGNAKSLIVLNTQASITRCKVR